MTQPLASVVIRTKEEATSIGRLLEILSGQTIGDRLERIVVDSGSRDGTVAIAREAGAQVIEMPAREFTFGRSLNLGCAQARTPIVIALSAHAFPYGDSWAERMLEAFEDERVACACGARADPSGRPLNGVFLQDFRAASEVPLYGYSNAAGGFRTELWKRRPFREDMPGTEDKEWAWHWLSEGHLVVFDPELLVDHDHSHDALPSVFERSRREWVGFAMYLDMPPFGVRDLARAWWTELDGHATAGRARLSPWRAARLLGEYAGRRARVRQ